MGPSASVRDCEDATDVDLAIRGGVLWSFIMGDSEWDDWYEYAEYS